MRLAIVSLMAAACLAPLAAAQTQPDTAPPAAPTPPPAAAAPTAPAPPETPSPAATAPAPADAAPAAAPLVPQAPPPPPPPPPPPTDPAAIALIKTLEDVCVPAATRGDKDLGKAARADGYRKSGDNWVLKGAGFQFTLLPPGSNPNACQLQLIHPVDVDEPAKTLVTAVHNWATFGHGWSLVSNYKNTQGANEYITRTWEHHADGHDEAIALTTTRNADNTPVSRTGDTSTLIYSNLPAS